MDGLLNKLGDLTDFLNDMGELVDKVDKRNKMGDKGELVELYVYDLSKLSHASSKKSSCSSGVAGFSMFWHTGIVAFGKEYTFNCNKGIDVTPVNRAEDIPDKTHVLGRTRKTENELKKVLEDWASTFNAKEYDLLKLNCQVFCSKLCQFLEVEGLPEYITEVREFVRDIFGTQENLEKTGRVVAGGAVVVGLAGIGYAAFKALSKNDDNKS